MSNTAITTREQAIKVLNTYFEFSTELRTVSIEDGNILTKDMIESQDTETLIWAAEDSQQDTRESVFSIYDFL